MLYERWRQIAREHRDAVALRDVARGDAWTFGQLAAMAESDAPSGPIIFPQGPEFVFTLLRAWHANKIVCPLESGQKPPAFTQFPPGCVHLKTTSATAGVARGVAFTGEQLAADAENIVSTMGLRPGWPNLGVISLAHSYGFSNLVLPLLLHGVPLILVDTPLPEPVRKAASLADFVTLAAVPALWRTWHDADAIPTNVKLAISAGAPLSLALEQSVFASCELKIRNFYGSSECGGIAFDDSSAPRSDASCAGRPMQNVHLSVGDDGCLQVRGWAVGTTYWPEPSPNLADGCFRTSDLVEIVGDRVYLRGRACDQINVAGRKLSPEVIEKALLSNPAVRECLVFGVPSADDRRAETIVACVTAAGEDAGSLRQFLLKELPAWQIPREWMFVDSLETNLRGKLSRAEWRQKFLEARGAKLEG